MKLFGVDVNIDLSVSLSSIFSSTKTESIRGILENSKTTDGAVAKSILWRYGDDDDDEDESLVIILLEFDEDEDELGDDEMMMMINLSTTVDSAFLICRIH